MVEGSGAESEHVSGGWKRLGVMDVLGGMTCGSGEGRGWSLLWVG